MRTLRTGDLVSALDSWMDPEERRVRLFGWSDEQVARLWLALGLELNERNVVLQEQLDLGA